MRTPLTVLSAIAVLTSTLLASTISYESYATSGTAINVNGSLANATASDSLNHTENTSNSCCSQNATSSYTIHAGFDKLGAEFAASTSNSGTSLSIGAGNYNLITTDRLLFTVNQGFLQLDVLFDGQYVLPGNTPQNGLSAIYDMSIFDGGGNQLNYRGAVVQTFLNGFTVDQLKIQGNGTAELDAPSTTLDSNGMYTTTMTGTLFIPFTLGFLDIRQNLHGDWGCVSGQNQSCRLAADFLNTAAVGGAVIVDANHQPIAGATISSQSGFDYTRSFASTSPVPEPGTWGLLTAGAALLFRFRPRRS